MGVSENIREQSGVTHEDLIMHSRIYSNTDLPVRIYRWSEPGAESGYNKHSTDGRMVIISAECLFELLKTSNQAIVFEVTISINDDSYKFYRTPRKPARSRKILVLEVDEQKNAPSWREYVLSADND